ncbi:MAG: ABC transporter permease [Bacteroidetes bacterium]|nr:ABC transporter permease [Bacteroidota bacterium]
MKTFIIKNLANSLLIVFGVLTVSFILTFMLPGDPAKMMLGQRADEESVQSVRKELGLDKPFYRQYISFISRAAKFDLGKSYITNRDVSATILEKFPATIILSLVAMIFAALLGILAGVISSIKPYTFYDYISTIISLFGISIPQFVLALLMVYIFGAELKWFPISGYVDNGCQYIVLPAFALALRPMAITARITRTSMLEVLCKDYVKTARAKGLSEFKVIFKHALRNALNPTVTALSSSFAATLGGVFFIEYIFNWPGIGSLAMDSIMKLDFPMIQGSILFSALVFVAINFMVDIAYAYLDPKVKLG